MLTVQETSPVNVDGRTTDLIINIAAGPNCRWLRIFYNVTLFGGTSPTITIGLFDKNDPGYLGPLVTTATLTATASGFLSVECPQPDLRLRFDLGGTDPEWSLQYTIITAQQIP